MADNPTLPPPAYFLALSLENVRSFGEAQTISFARPDGRPAQWTIMLGDNGVGKTTVLKSLAALMLAESSYPVSKYEPAAEAQKARQQAAHDKAEFAGMVWANFPHLPH